VRAIVDAGHLEAWMNAPERKALLAESKEFIESEELMRLATAFPGWVPLDPMTGEGPPNWKTAMLVLLGLFPIVHARNEVSEPGAGGPGHSGLAGHIHWKCHQRGAHQLPDHAVVCELVRMVALSQGQRFVRHDARRADPDRALRPGSYFPLEVASLVISKLLPNNNQPKK
jgi:hypothetical protein